MTIIAAAEQRTSDWFAARAGKVTASRVKDVLSKLKSGKPAAERDRYLWELAAERLTGESTRHFTNAAMNHGVEHEVTARIEYEWRAGIQVQEIGFCIHRELDHFGCSPDGLVGEYGLVEIKCPFGSHVHLQTLTSGEMPPEHMPQVQAQMAVMGKEWVDFVSFDPRMPEPINLFVTRINRDEQYIENMLTEVRGFLAEVDDLVQRIKTKVA